MSAAAQALADKDFQSASAPEQMTYLSHVDPDFASASSEDKLAYLNHVTGKAAPTTANNEVERNAPTPYLGFGLSNLAENAKRGLSELGSGALEMGKDIIAPPGQTEGDRLSYLGNKYIFNPADREAKLAQTAPNDIESFGHSLAESIPIVGPWAASLGEQAGHDPGGALARGGTQVAAAEVAPTLARGLKFGLDKGREAVGGAIRTPEGELTPNAKLTAKVGGGLGGMGLGTAMGHEPYIGALAGYRVGPSLMEGLFPEPSSRIAARDAFESTKNMTEAQEAALKEKDVRERRSAMDTRRAAAANPENTELFRGSASKVADAEYQRAKEVTEAQEAAKAAQAARLGKPGLTLEPGAQGTTATNNTNLGPLPQRLGTGLVPPTATTTTGGQFVGKITPPEPSKIVEPGSTPPPQKITGQSWSRDNLISAIKDPQTPYQTRVLMAKELLRNLGDKEFPANFRYLLEGNAPMQPWRNLKR